MNKVYRIGKRIKNRNVRLEVREGEIRKIEKNYFE